ncbi:MAG TPA: MBL fold metallo-hydrolase [Chitinophagaceae bacterium]|nr:MBL fold metallo-hydrolase [Chitinophagaceae bacterium]
MLHIESFTFGPFQENTYLLYNDRKEAIIIDPGMYELNEFDTFFARISQLGLQPRILLNTHTHIDHIFGNAAVKMKYQVPFGFHKADQPVFDSAKQSGALFGFTFVTSPPPDFYIDHNEPFVFGEDSFRVLFTPGHSPGSVCFYHEKDQFLIAGDVLFQLSIGRTDLPGGDHETLMNSIQQHVFALPDETRVYCGHGPSTTIGFEKMNNPFVGIAQR